MLRAYDSPMATLEASWREPLLPGPCERRHASRAIASRAISAASSSHATLATCSHLTQGFVHFTLNSCRVRFANCAWLLPLLTWIKGIRQTARKLAPSFLTGLLATWGGHTAGICCQLEGCTYVHLALPDGDSTAKIRRGADSKEHQHQNTSEVKRKEQPQHRTLTT